MDTQNNGEEHIGHVLGTDLISFSALSLEKQLQAIQKLQELLNQVLIETPNSTRIDAGDGAFIIFTGSILPCIVAAELLCTLAAAEDLQLRIAVHSGPLVRQSGISGNDNVYGPGINICQRLVAAAAEGEVLVSQVATEFARVHSEYADRFQSRATVEAKHGTKLAAFAVIPGKSRQVPETISSIPVPERRLIGRASELERLYDLVVVQRRRLVTVLGSGGIGKSSLCIEFAREFSSNFTDGVIFVECDHLASQDEIATSMMHSVSPRSSGSISEILRGMEALVVLDCVEQIPDVYVVIEQIVRSCPQVQFLVSSRSLVGSRYETEFELLPLTIDRSKGSLSAASELFMCCLTSLSRASLKSAERAQIDEIVATLEGVPLAIVLAAGRLKYLSLDELAESVRSAPLKTLYRNVHGPDKHSDMSQVVQDSMSLLDASLQETLIELSVFAGGFTVRDAELVLEGTSDVARRVEQLRDRSLLSGKIVQSRMRFRSLDVVSQYIREIASSRDLRHLHFSHASYFASKAVYVRKIFDDARWEQASSLLWADLANFRRGISRAIEDPDASLTLKYASALSRILMEAGLISDFERLFRASYHLADPALKIELNGLMGGVKRREGSLEMAEQYWSERALELSALGEFEREADAWNDLVGMFRLSEDWEKVDQYLEKLDAIEANTPIGIVRATTQMFRGHREFQKGNTVASQEFAEMASQTLSQSVINSRSFFASCNLAELWELLQQYQRSVDTSLGVLPHVVSSRHPAYAANLLRTLAASWIELGRSDYAAKALVAGSKVPKSVSREVWTRIQVIRELYVDKFGLQPLESAESAYSRTEWQTLALELSVLLGDKEPEVINEQVRDDPVIRTRV